MPIELNELISTLVPEHTILFFGSGSSIPSGAPSTQALSSHLAMALGPEFSATTFALTEIAQLVEKRKTRRFLIEQIQSQFRDLKPTGGLRNIPLFNWKNIYTTNYDTLIEDAYNKAGRELATYVSNFDFSNQPHPTAAKLFKLHGTLSQDIALNHNSRLIVTEADYEATSDYREKLYGTLGNDLSTSAMVIIGNSLSDPDIREAVKTATDIAKKTHSNPQITLLMFEEDLNRAQLFELKNVQVAFGGIDDFFAKMPKNSATYEVDCRGEDDPLGFVPTLRPVTTDVPHAREVKNSNVSAMFAGWPASYADIVDGLTFPRSISSEIENAVKSPELVCLSLLGVSGVGKTTAARQALSKLATQGLYCWEHMGDHELDAEDWIKLASHLHKIGKTGVVLVDDAHSHLFALNRILDAVAVHSPSSLKFVLVSSRHNWEPRVKSPVIFKRGKRFDMSKLDDREIKSLLHLVETNNKIKPLIENTFAGFSEYERTRRLTLRCEKDFFVCLKNIFASEKIDDILLREFATLAPKYQEIYRLVAALESSGVRVHRQLVIRAFGIEAGQIPSMLENLQDIIAEYTIDKRNGIFGWRGRHPVVTGVITKYKFTKTADFVSLFSLVIDETLPTYEIEVRSIRQLCNLETGLARMTLATLAASPVLAAPSPLLKGVVAKVHDGDTSRWAAVRRSGCSASTPPSFISSAGWTPSTLSSRRHACPVWRRPGRPLRN